MQFITNGFVPLHSDCNWEENIKSFNFHSVSDKLEELLFQEPKMDISSFWPEIYAATTIDFNSKFLVKEEFSSYKLAELSHILYSRKFLLKNFLRETATIIAPGTIIEESYYPMLFFLDGFVNLTLKDINDNLIEGDNIMFIRC